MSEPVSNACPISPALTFFAQKWLAHIIWALGRSGEMRFQELRRSLPGNISARVLVQRLRDLESDGMVCRRQISDKPLKVAYALTEDGLALDGLLLEVDRLSRGVRLPAAAMTPDDGDAVR